MISATKSSEPSGNVAILVGGGPAPGINAVIAAATIRARLCGHGVVGVVDGFSGIMVGDTSKVRELSIDDVQGVHFRGGSFLGISRANPTKKPELLEAAVASLQRLGVDKLITIGGDDTCFSSSKIQEQSKGRIRVVHVPKTIDNDLDLPDDTETFGFQTARHVGVELLENLIVDARTTTRWYLVIAMGRKAGHLALGMGKAAGAAISLIPEEFPEGEIKLAEVVDTLACAIVKRLADGHGDGVAVIAEGLVERMNESDLEGLAGVERDAHGHIRIAEVPFGDILKDKVQKRLAEYKIKATIVAKNIGYELRCADPIPFDMEYCRDLGYCAATYVSEGGNAALISMISGTFRALPFAEMMDAGTGKIRVRYVDVASDRYAIARRFMQRLRPEDLGDARELARLGAVAGLSGDAFAKRFGYVAAHEPKSRALFTAD